MVKTLLVAVVLAAFRASKREFFAAFLEIVLRQQKQTKRVHETAFASVALAKQQSVAVEWNFAIAKLARVHQDKSTNSKVLHLCRGRCLGGFSAHPGDSLVP